MKDQVHRPVGVYYGWIVAAVLFLSLMVFWGTFYSFGVFLKPLSREFGWTRAEISWAFALSMGVQGILGIVAGVVTDRFGPRMIMIISCLATSLGYALTYWASSLWHLYIFYGVLVAVGTGASWVVPIATIPRWFFQNRGLALGIVLSSIGAGQMVLPPVLTHITTQSGWRASFVLMGALVMLVGLPCALLLKVPGKEGGHTEGANGIERNAVPSPQPSTTKEALVLPRFWLLFALWLLVAIPLQMIMVHLVPYATDAGVSPPQAALLMTIMGATVTTARIGVGWLSDRVGNKSAYLVSLSLQTAALLGLLAMKDFFGFGLAAAFFGIGYGGAAIVYPKIVADAFGVKSLGAIIGILGLGWTIGAVLGPPLGGLVFDLWGNYFLAFIGGGMIMGIALIVAYNLLRIKPSASNHTSKLLKHRT